MNFRSARSLNFPRIYDVVKQTLTKLLKVENPLFWGETVGRMNGNAPEA